MRPIRSRKDGLQEVRGQTGEGVSHYVPVAKPQNGRRRFLRDVVRTAGGWLPWVWRWGYNSKPHAHLAAVAPARSHKRERLCQCLCAFGQCVQACPYDTLKLATLASACRRARHILSHGIFLAKCVRHSVRQSVPERCAGS